MPFDKCRMTRKGLCCIALACAPGRVPAGHAVRRFLACRNVAARGVGRLSMSANMARHVNAKLLLLLLLIALALAGAMRPMQAVHWDAPIYFEGSATNIRVALW